MYEAGPMFAHLLAQEEARKAQTPKLTALGTILRYSGAYGCARRMGYDAFDANYTESPTPASVWQATMGTIIGEKMADAIIRAYPQARAEEPSQLSEFISGSADVFIPASDIGPVVYENKKKGSYAFNKALGYSRRFGKIELKNPEGPPWDAVVQAGLNALGIQAKFPGMEPIFFVVVGVVSDDIVTVKENRQVDISDFNRFAQEWHVPADDWMPETMSEYARLSEVAETIDLGYLPDRWARNDAGHDIKLDPFGENWQCDYCPYRTLCVNDGEGQVRILDSRLERRDDV